MSALASSWRQLVASAYGVRNQLCPDDRDIQCVHWLHNRLQSVTLLMPLHPRNKIENLQWYTVDFPRGDCLRHEWAESTDAQFGNLPTSTLNDTSGSWETVVVSSLISWRKTTFTRNTHQLFVCAIGSTVIGCARTMQDALSVSGSNQVTVVQCSNTPINKQMRCRL